tara:strand:- start:41 stop:223 length:183 start_codon:yes stop_codon:yes gene_type:complete
MSWKNIINKELQRGQFAQLFDILRTYLSPDAMRDIERHTAHTPEELQNLINILKKVTRRD